MSQENVELFREAVDAVSEQDLARLIELTDPEVEWHSLLAQVGEGGVYRGHPGIKRYVHDLNEAWEFLRSSIDDTLALGDLVLAVGRLRYRGKGSGVEMDSAAGYLSQFRAQKIVYMRAFREPQETLLSLGLSE
jgi:ketosteroid isomerase-like protein